MNNCPDSSFWFNAYIARVQIRGAFSCHLQSISKAYLTSYKVRVYEIDETIAVTGFRVRNVMTSNIVVPVSTALDKVTISLRLGANNFLDLDIFRDIANEYIESKEAARVRRKGYEADRCPSVIHVPLHDFRNSLDLESGGFKGWGGRCWPYITFTFNVQSLSRNQHANERFHQVLDDLIPHGGYRALLEDGYVNYVEFAADFRGVAPESIDIYHRGLRNNRYERRGKTCKTINLFDEFNPRRTEICMYDKQQADKERKAYYRRGPRLRIEAKCRLNRTPTHRQLHLNQVKQLPNPFSLVKVYDRESISQTFTAARHRHFLARAVHFGVHEALNGTRGADRRRRERMLKECEVVWWNPKDVWDQLDEAIRQGMSL